MRRPNPTLVPAGRAPARLLGALALAATLALAGAPRAALADTYVDRVNAMLPSVPDDKRSDLILLPALARLDPVPGPTDDPRPLLVQPPDSPVLKPWYEWLNAQPQRDALAALKKATDDENPRTHPVFALPYGIDNVPIEFIEANLYIDLGDPPLLQAGEFHYLGQTGERGVGALVIMSVLEAKRLFAEGKPADAVETLLDLLFFSRQLADRPMAREVLFGMAGMALALEHIRDIAYLDFRSPTPGLTPDQLRDYVKRLEERGAVGTDRIRPAPAAGIAGAQLLDRIYALPGGTPNQRTFAPTIARIQSQDLPLTLFSERARWEAARAVQADYQTAKRRLEGAVNDLDLRWNLRLDDPLQATPPEARLARTEPSLAAILPALDLLEGLGFVRQMVRAEAAGTRMSLAVLAFHRQNRSFPAQLTSVRPAFAAAIDRDPYLARPSDISFFVPVRDQGNIPFHEVRVIPFSPDQSSPRFSARLRADTFLIYAAGPDGVRGFALDNTQGDPRYREGDYLLWPPAISLYREFLAAEGRLDDVARGTP